MTTFDEYPTESWVFDEYPTPFTEVIILIDGKRNPMFSNSYMVVAYWNGSCWIEERHPDSNITGVMCWQHCPTKPAVVTRGCPDAFKNTVLNRPVKL